MRRQVFLLSLLLLLTGSFLWAQSDTSSQSQSSLRGGDVIHLRVYNNRGVAEIDQDLMINDSGDIDLPLVGFVNVAGLNINKLHETLNKVLAESAFKGPRVQVSIVKLAQTDRIYVWGGVKTPGPIEIRDKVSLMDAVKMAGGFFDDILGGGQGQMYGGTNYYDTRGQMSLYMVTQSLDYLAETKVRRAGKEFKVDIKKLIKEADMSQNIDLQPNDVLIIPTRANISPKLDETIYILGAVAQPARYRYRDEMSVLEAIYMAGGLVNQHTIKFASIIRGLKGVQPADKEGKPIKGGFKAGGAKPEIIKVDIRSLMFRGEIQNDQKLKGGDLLLVSTREYRNFLSEFGKFVDNFMPIFNRAATTVGYDTTIRQFNDRFIINKNSGTR